MGSLRGSPAVPQSRTEVVEELEPYRWLILRRLILDLLKSYGAGTRGVTMLGNEDSVTSPQVRREGRRRRGLDQHPAVN